MERRATVRLDRDFFLEAADFVVLFDELFADFVDFFAFEADLTVRDLVADVRLAVFA